MAHSIFLVVIWLGARCGAEDARAELSDVALSGFIGTAQFKNWIERSFEIIAVVEVLATIALRFLHVLDANQVVNDLAKVAGREYTPIVEHRFGHKAKLLQRMQPNGFA